MSNMSFFVSAHWDEDAEVFYSESNIVGLHIEASTIEEFEGVMKAVAPSLVLENHITKKDLTQKSWADMIPAIFFKQPTLGAATA